MFRVRILCAKRTDILAYSSPIIKDSRVLTLIWDRAVAYKYALHLQPERAPHRELFDALELGARLEVLWAELRFRRYQSVQNVRNIAI